MTRQTMFTERRTSIISLAAVMAACLFEPALAQETAHEIVPFKTIPSEQWIEVVSGDPSRAGEPFVLRIHNDPGYVVFPHTHPGVENVVVIQGTWSVAMGSRLDRSSPQPVEVGDYISIPAGMAHFGRAMTEVTVQIHGIGPFSIDYVEPRYDLTEAGVALAPGVPDNAPRTPGRSCFQLEIGDTVRSANGTGTIVGAQCSPANNFTQYWVEVRVGERFWVTLGELTTP